MSRPVPVVVAPLEEELRPFLSRIEARSWLRNEDLRAHRGQLGGRELVAAVIGDGAGRAERGLERLLAEVEPQRLLLIGVAGGLSPDLTAGSTLRAESVLSPRRGQLGAPDGNLGGLTRGTIVAVDQIACTAAAKQALWNDLGRPESCAVDLESWVFAERAEGLGCPWTIVRAISDTAAEDLPLDFAALSDAEGAVVRSRVLLSLLRRPGALKGLLEIRSRVRECAVALRDVAERWTLNG